MINILICMKPFYFNYILYFLFFLHNSTGEARPHLPPLTARPWLVAINQRFAHDFTPSVDWVLHWVFDLK